MRYWIAWLPLFACLQACTVGQGSTSPQVRRNTIEEIFNGRDLTGWVEVLDPSWSVEDGVLVARRPPGGAVEGESWLFTQKDFSDFVLTMSYRVAPGAKGGVVVRDPVARTERLAVVGGGPKPWDSGLEVQLGADDAECSAGGIAVLDKGPRGLELVGEWNQLKVKVQGDHIQTWVNRAPAIDVAHSRIQQGAIGFRRRASANAADKVVEIKNLYVQILGVPSNPNQNIRWVSPPRQPR